MTPEPVLKLRRYLLFPGLVFLACATVAEVTEFDLLVSRNFYDADLSLWTYGDTAWANTWLHKGGRDLIFLVGVSAITTLVLSYLRGNCRRWRRPALYLVASIALGTGVVAGLKQITEVDCPWNLEDFGGNRPYVHIFENRPEGLPPGRCFPGGHSSGAFSLFGVFFILQDRNSPKAKLALLGTLGLGALFAFGQWVRGAHFVSHDLWSAFICWIVALGLYLGPFRGRLWPRKHQKAGVK